MKKILLAMAALLGCATMSFAQNNYVATLQHEGEFTHYYGADALKSAYNAADEGDIITLSPGTFNSPGTINKGITLRGTGIDAAAVSYVSGDVTFCSTDSTRVTIVEGIIFSNENCIQNNSSGTGQGSLLFVKNNFPEGIRVTNASSYSTVKGPKVRFYDGVINMHLYFYKNTYPDIFVYNCFVVCPWSESGFSETASAFVNCVVYYNSDHARYAYNINFYNCIFTFGTYGRCVLNNTATCINCVSVNFSGFFNSQIYGSNNINVANDAAIFSSVEGHKWYELTPEAQKTYLGTDGTQVGFYGGTYPYNTKVQYPVITQFNTDVQTSKEGILNINVEVDGK